MKLTGGNIDSREKIPKWHCGVLKRDCIHIDTIYARPDNSKAF